MGENPCSYIAHKELTHRELKKKKKKTPQRINNSLNKWAKEIKRQFS
jgi:hypothetical protein